MSLGPDFKTTSTLRSERVNESIQPRSGEKIVAQGVSPRSASVMRSSPERAVYQRYAAPSGLGHIAHVNPWG